MNTWGRRALAATLGIAVVFALLLGTALLGVTALQGARGFVLGEGLWAKAQKRSVLALYRYADSGDPGYFAEFEREIGITLSDRRARLELLRDDPDRAVVREGLEGGQLPPSVIDAMYLVTRLGRSLPFVRESMAIWQGGDEGIDELRSAADVLRERIEGGASREEIRAVLDRIDAIDGELTLLERDFSDTFNSGALEMERVLSGVLLAMGLGLALTAAVSGRSVTSRFRAHEAQLARSETRYRQLFERNLLGAALISPEGVVLEANQAFAEMFGYGGPEELVGLSTEVFYADVSERGPIREELEREGRLTTREAKVRRKDGSLMAMLATSVLLPHEDGDRVLTTVLDISEQRALEEELARSRRLEAMGQIAGGVAHDFNNLLTVIQGNTSLALEQSAADGGRADLLEEIAASAEAAAALTAQLLDFSRGQAPDVQSTDVRQAVERHLALLARLLPDAVTCEARVADGLPPVRLTRAHLDQVILNLTLNARDAMPDGGVLTLTAEPAAAAPDEDVPRVDITVGDTGTGMDAETQARIFEPFFSTKARGRGTGMGLATVYGIVTRAGGDIEVDSEAGRGTKVRVTLPGADAATPEEPGVEKGGADPPPARTGGTRTVLLVEDTEPVRVLTRRVLERIGFTVVEAADGPSALRLLEGESEPPVLVISDIVMPGMDGPELVGRIRRIHPKVPVIYMSGYTDQALEPEELEREATAFLPKPFRSQELRDAIEAILTRADVWSD